MIDVHAEGQHGRWVATCQPRFRPAVERLLALVATDGVDPAGGTAHFAWWPLSVTRDGADWRVWSSIGPDPRDLTALAGVHLLQLTLCRRFSADPVGVAPDDLVALAPGALDSERLMLRRGPAQGGHSGWHVRPDGPLVVYDDPYEQHTVQDLFRARTGLLAPLVLGEGWFARMEGDDVVEARFIAM